MSAQEPTTDERLMDSALRLIGRLGYHGATTRAIAAAAEVSEVTLFRRFGSKAELTGAALANVTEAFRSAGSEPTDDVVADLVRLVDAYRQFVQARPGLVARLLAEATVESEIGSHVIELIGTNAASASIVVAHHQRSGRLIEAPTGDVVAALLGPVLLEATVGGFLNSEPTTATDLVTRFLAGFGV